MKPFLPILALSFAVFLCGCRSSDDSAFAPVGGGAAGAGAVAAPPPPLCTPGGPGSPATVIGPIAGDAPGSASRNYPWMATDVDLRGYIEEEYFFCGFITGGDYTTRMVVRRPADASRFNGTVLAEWLNVTNFHDLELLWGRTHAHLMRAGYAYVGISAQRAGAYGPDGLITWSPLRYGQLHWPGGDAGGIFNANVVVSAVDPAAYEIFTQALQALRTTEGVRPLGGSPVKWLVATGGSQSGATLQAYHHFFHPLARTADAFLPFIWTTGSLDDHPTDIAPLPVNPDLVGTPFFLVNSETDTDISGKPDTALYRQWEVAGTTHRDKDDVDHRGRLLLRDAGIDLTVGLGDCALPPLSRIPLKHVLNAAMDLTVRWLETGMPPPSQPRFQYGLEGQPARDEHGNVLGGIRLPEQEVPIATNSRNNSGSTACYRSGSYTPFDAATLRALYPTHADYVQKFDAAADAAVAAGVLLPEDAAISKAAARNAPVPP